MLQPRQPAMWHPLSFSVIAMQGVCGKKELELLGATGVSAAGSTTFFVAGGGTSDACATTLCDAAKCSISCTYA